MNIFHLFQSTDINAGVEQFLHTKNAILLDVRTEEEYREGHIEEGINIPLQKIAEISKRVPDKEHAIFVHCLSGARSVRAKEALRQMGYNNVVDIGGINGYKGKIVRG